VSKKGEGGFSYERGREIGRGRREKMKPAQDGFRFEMMREDIAIEEGKGWWGTVQATFGYV
jgi:hypothetical protein